MWEKEIKRINIKIKMTVIFICISVPFSIFNVYVLASQKFTDPDKFIYEMDVFIAHAIFTLISFFVIGLWKIFFYYGAKLWWLLLAWGGYLGVVFFFPWILAIEKIIRLRDKKTDIEYQKSYYNYYYTGGWQTQYTQDAWQQQTRQSQEESKYRKMYEEQMRREKEREKQNLQFFSNCNDKESLEKRYKALVKAYHPDMGFGDNETFVEIQKQYDELKKRFT